MRYLLGGSAREEFEAALGVLNALHGHTRDEEVEAVHQQVAEPAALDLLISARANEKAVRK